MVTINMAATIKNINLIHSSLFIKVDFLYKINSKVYHKKCRWFKVK